MCVATVYKCSTVLISWPWVNVKFCSQLYYIMVYIFQYLKISCTLGMCPGFEEWWLYEWSPKLVIFNFYAQIMPKRFLVHTIYVRIYVLCKAASN